jgi:hypothetical protein
LWELAAERLTEDVLADAVARAVEAAGTVDTAGQLKRPTHVKQPGWVRRLRRASVEPRASMRRAAHNVDAVALDPSIVAKAAEAAILALHQRALADVAAAPDDHWFRIKFALFESGRWPLGLRSGRFYLV